MAVQLLVVGSVNQDLVLEVERAPAPGETVMGDAYSYVPGGKGANQAVAAARLGAAARLCARVGADAAGDALIAGFHKDALDTSCVIQDDTAPTGLAVIPVEADGQNRILVFSGANRHLCAEDVDLALRAPTDVMLLQLEIPIAVVRHAIASAKRVGAKVVLDAGPATALPLDTFTGVDLLSPNEAETQALTGIRPDGLDSAYRAACLLLEGTGAKHIVLKMGEKGAYWLEKGGEGLLIPARNVTPVDTTAAGDCFTAALAIRWAQGEALPDAIAYANAAAALSVTRKGAQPSLPTASEVADFV